MCIQKTKKMSQKRQKADDRYQVPVIFATSVL